VRYEITDYERTTIKPMWSNKLAAYREWAPAHSQQHLLHTDQ
jgi:hypothetical protein